MDTKCFAVYNFFISFFADAHRNMLLLLSHINVYNHHRADTLFHMRRKYLRGLTSGFGLMRASQYFLCSHDMLWFLSNLDCWIYYEKVFLTIGYDQNESSLKFFEISSGFRKLNFSNVQVCIGIFMLSDNSHDSDWKYLPTTRGSIENKRSTLKMISTFTSPSLDKCSPASQPHSPIRIKWWRSRGRLWPHADYPSSICYRWEYFAVLLINLCRWTRQA